MTSRRRFGPLPNFLLDLAVAALALGVAGWMFFAYLPGSDGLWRDVFHDRHTHLTAGMRFGLAISHLDPGTFFDQLQRSKVWPPVHALVLGIVFAVDPDHRLGVLPSLLGWAMTAFFSWKIAVRLFSDRPSGMAAGFLAVALSLGSPAFALISTDVMLEGLGSGFSAFCVWAFIAASQDANRRWRWNVLALGLTVLFFEKYNYWAFVVAALALASLVIFQPVRTWLLAALSAMLRYLPRLVRLPLFVAGLIVLALVFYISSRGPTSLELFGRNVSLYPPNTLLTVAYALLFIASLQVWRGERQRIRPALGMPGMAILALHVLPVAISFLPPQRLSAFAWFLGPSNGGSRVRFDPSAAFDMYSNAFLDGFVVVHWLGFATLALAGVAILASRMMVREWAVVPAFIAVSVLALLLHPQHQPRFLSTSVFAVWIAAGAGFAIVVRSTAGRRNLLLPATGALAAAALIAFQLGLPYRQEAYSVALHRTQGPSDLGLARAYMPYINPSQHLAIVSAFGWTDALYWPLMEECRCLSRPDSPWLQPEDTHATVVEKVEKFLAATTADQIILIDIPAMRWSPLDYENTKGMMDVAKSQTAFVETAVMEYPDPPGRIHILTRR